MGETSSEAPAVPALYRGERGGQRRSALACAGEAWTHGAHRSAARSCLPAPRGGRPVQAWAAGHRASEGAAKLNTELPLFSNLCHTISFTHIFLVPAGIQKKSDLITWTGDTQGIGWLVRGLK